jgi:hypothetical protein
VSGLVLLMTVSCVCWWCAGDAGVVLVVVVGSVVGVLVWSCAAELPRSSGVELVAVREVVATAGLWWMGRHPGAGLLGSDGLSGPHRVQRGGV